MKEYTKIDSFYELVNINLLNRRKLVNASKTNNRWYKEDKSAS